MVERKKSSASLGRLLFIGPLSGAREKLLEDLRALGMHAESAPTLDAAGARLAQCDFVLAAVSNEGHISKLKGVREAGKTMGLVLRPEDKALASIGLKAGARVVLGDDVHPDEVVQFVHSLTEEGILRREVRWLRTEFRESGPRGGVPGSSAPAERLNRAIKRAGKRYRVVLARGEKGSNFLQLARAAHHQYPGLRHPLLHWEASQRPAAALGKALTRLEQGKGDEGELLRLGGSLFIEDAQLMSPALQKRLAEITCSDGISPEFRLILGQTQDPERLFEDDFFPRLEKDRKALVVRIPPLRERRKDIPELADAILGELASRVGGERRALTPAAEEYLTSESWWGNENQLELYLWRAYLLTDGRSISVDDLKPSKEVRKVSDIEEFFRERLASVVSCLRDGQDSDFYSHTIRSVEKPLLELVLHESGGNQLKAARLLGMNRNTLRRRLSELGLVRRVPGRSRSRER
ncbi:MAG: hypothetical protein HOG04_06965 [Nitrospinaceae bacterium]|nr:hypothetical protein [Nitrospinaceae bacterium]